jgi:YD repeat-containing protein
MSPPPTVLDDQFVQNSFTWALVRNPSSSETTYWHDQLRVGYAQGQTSIKLAAIELGRTLFESAEYAARNRNDHWYVYDLYKTYLMRDPDSTGWAFWESQLPANGRESVRRGFEESGEFAGIIGSIVPNGSATANAASLISAQVDPRNQPGNGMLTRDASWSVPLLSLPGRAGLDLGLGLSYSSQVWTRSGPYIYFDEDNGFPSPGFRLGFPTVQRKVFDAQTARNAYLLKTAAGRRVEMRQVGTSNIYDAYDSSYLRLTDNGATLLVHATDGTKLSFNEINGEYRCIEIKDRNGNYITVNYNALGRITTITDTLGRVITFNYDGNANLLSITQSWNGQPSHQWVSFGWGTRTMQSSFSNVAVVGTANGTVLPVITQVGLNDTSHFTFDYTNSLQLSLVRNYFGALQRNETVFTYETPASDAPRLVDSRVSAHNWTAINGVPLQVITQYSVAGDGACVMTAPDGTIYKEYYGTGWQKGLTTLSEVWSGGVRQKWTTTTWTQDNTSVGYEVNPRVTETNAYDASSNRRRTVIDYGSYWQYGLPYIVREYAADAVTILRETYTDYNLSQAYLDRRIIGLISEIHLTNGSQYQSKITYAYDDPARLHGVPAAATRHDTAYNTSFTKRGNVTAVSRWDVTDINNAAQKLTTYSNYYNTGTPISTTDPAGHQSNITYADSFSDSVNRNTFAYPTTITDADGFSAYLQYNFDFGATTRTQSPTPAGQSQGTIQTMTYNSLGRLERITTTNNGAYRRFWYGADFTASYATVNNTADELYAIQVTDGVGRVIGAAGNHPGSSGGYRLVNTIYNSMGRVWKQSNPTEVNSSWAPSGDDSSGIYYTQQTYDWQGRPLVTTNPDGTTREASYSGCGCAGGAVVTLTDEGTIDNGVAKRRQQKIYSDVLGRAVKTEILNWQGGSVYSATVNTYNARDQVTQIRQYAGAEGSGTFQDTAFTFDGYGRLKTKHVPEQDVNKNTTWDYNSDDTIQKVTDGRGAATNYSYNNRHLLTGISYSVPSQPPIPVPGAANFSYDAAANRTTMTDGTGTTTYSYDSLSRLTSESRTFNGYSGTYALNYSYNLANALTVLAIPFKSQQVGYNYDTAGRLSGVTASGFSATHYVWPNQYTQNLTSFASNISYRAWGGRKSMTYGNTTSEQFTYNARLQPATYTLSNMNYQNTNICCSYPTYSTMTWTYGYYNDGSVKHAWDATNEWFDRAYKYDHAGRLKEASTFRRARDLSPYPAINYPDPYYQNITYDAFNHSSRTGKLFTGEPSDIGTYVNNRRTDFGWQYDAAGNAIVDASYSQTFDAAGKVKQSISHAKVGDGVQYPLEPRLDITQTYDGNGAPAKREQISRQRGLIDLEGNEGEPIVDEQTTYYVRSSVLGGAPVVELGWGDTVHIYAGGQRIAREYWGSVTFEHHNPVNGSRVTSHGHSSYRTTGREERDPRGAETPLSNPFAGGTQNYVDWKFSQPLFIEGGDPFDYTSGLMIDGLPVSASEFARRANSGSLGIVFSGAISGIVPVIPLGLGFFGYDRPSGWRHDEEGPKLDWESGTFSASAHSRRWRQSHHPQKPYRTPLSDQEVGTLENALKTLLENEKCAKFVAGVLQKLGSKAVKTFALTTIRSGAGCDGAHATRHRPATTNKMRIGPQR